MQCVLCVCAYGKFIYCYITPTNAADFSLCCKAEYVPRRVESATNRKFDKNNLYVLRMETIDIKVAEYYNQPKYFPYMPEPVFNALEEAFIAGKEAAIVPKAAFETMLLEFNNK